MAEILKKRGRPRQNDEAKRSALSLRTTPELRDKIGEAAERSGRSLAQEIEFRLEMSFAEENLVGSSEMALFFKLFAGTVALIELETGKKWTEDRSTWEAVSTAARSLLDGFQPAMDSDLFEKHRPAMWAFMEPALELDRISTKIEGLRTAFFADEDMPIEVRRELDKAEVLQRELLKKAEDAAQAVFEGPLKEQEDRREAMEILARKITGKMQGKDRFNFEMGHGQGDELKYAIGRMFIVSGAVEPLPKLRGQQALTDEDLIRGIRRIAKAAEARTRPDEQRE